MKRDMDLVRGILLKIEDEFVDTEIRNLSVEGYDMQTVAYHCQIMYDAGLLIEYNPIECDQGLLGFIVGGLSWDGNDYLDKIRDNSIWSKTKETITKKGLPLIFDTIKTVSTAFITATAEGIANSIIKNGGNI